MLQLQHLPGPQIPIGQAALEWEGHKGDLHLTLLNH